MQRGGGGGGGRREPCAHSHGTAVINCGGVGAPESSSAIEKDACDFKRQIGCVDYSGDAFCTECSVVHTQAATSRCPVAVGQTAASMAATA